MYVPSACQVSTKLNNDWSDSIEGSTYHHFIVHRIVNVLVPSNIIECAISGIDVGGTLNEPRVHIMVIFHREFQSVMMLIGRMCKVAQVLPTMMGLPVMVDRNNGSMGGSPDDSWWNGDVQHSLITLWQAVDRHLVSWWPTWPDHGVNSSSQDY